MPRERVKGRAFRSHAAQALGDAGAQLGCRFPREGQQEYLVSGYLPALMQGRDPLDDGERLARACTRFDDRCRADRMAHRTFLFR